MADFTVYPVIDNFMRSPNALSARTAIGITDHTDISLIQSTSGNWDSTYTTVSANSASWVGGGDVSALSGNWESTYTTVGANSASWDERANLTDVIAASGNWDSTYTTVQTESAGWVGGGGGGSDVSALSGNWESTYTTVQTESAGWAGGGSSTEVVYLSWHAPNDVAVTGVALAYIVIPSTLDGYTLTSVHAEVFGTGTTGTQTFDINKNNATMLTTKLTIDSGDAGSDTAGAAAVIDTGNNTVSQYDRISVDVDTIHDVPAQGELITLEFEPPA